MQATDKHAELDFYHLRSVTGAAETNKFALHKLQAEKQLGREIRRDRSMFHRSLFQPEFVLQLCEVQKECALKEEQNKKKNGNKEQESW